MGAPAYPDGASLQMTGVSLAAAVFILSLATFVVILDTTIINVAIPHIAGAFAASVNEGIWTITSYAVAEAFTIPLSGWLVARFGVVRTFLVAIVGFAVFSAMGARMVVIIHRPIASSTRWGGVTRMIRVCEAGISGPPQRP